MSAMPFSIIGSTQQVKTPDGRQVLGRQYSWGVAEVENEDHCDFKRLRNLLIRNHMLDLISTTEEIHYENYRQQQMASRKFGEPKYVAKHKIIHHLILISPFLFRVKKYENPKHREKEDLLRKQFTEQVKAEENRFRQWEQQVHYRIRGSSIYIAADNYI